MNGTPENQMLEFVPNVIVLIGIEKGCTKCGNVKRLDLFSPQKGMKLGKAPACRECCAAGNRKYRKEHPQESRESSKKWRESNPEIHASNVKRWRDNNIEKRARQAIEWRNNNPERARETGRIKNRRRYGTLKGNINRRMACGMNYCLKGTKRGQKWESLAGYSAVQLMQHLEKQFRNGMSWDNKELWHIDHKIPIAAFNFNSPDDIDFKRCWALDNLRPLWKEINMSKGARLDKPFQPSLAIPLCVQEGVQI